MTLIYGKVKTIGRMMVMRIQKSMAALVILLSVLFFAGCQGRSIGCEDSLAGESGAPDALLLPEEMPEDFSILFVWHYSTQWNGINTYRGVIYKEAEKYPIRIDYEIPREDLEQIYRELKDGINWIPGTGEPVHRKRFDCLPDFIVEISFDGKVYPLTGTEYGENGYFELGDFITYMVSYIEGTDEWNSVSHISRRIP